MNFLWPQFLWLLLAVPVLVLLYLLAAAAQEEAGAALCQPVDRARGDGRRLRRCAATSTAKVVAMLVAAARPMAVVVLPSNQQTIILAMDVSGNMRAEDVKPNRLVAAQDAAKGFIKDLPRHVKVGVVAFADANVAQLPTTNREELVAAIDSFQLQRATATGNAIVVSLATLFPDAGIDVSDFGAQSRRQGIAIEQAGKQKKEFTPVAPGSFTSACIIAADRRPAHYGRGPAGRRQGRRRPRRARLHRGRRHGRWRDHRLRGLVDARAAGRGNPQGGGQADLGRVLLRRHGAGPEEGLRHAELAPDGGEEGAEISALFALGAALLALLSAGISLLWFNRILYEDEPDRLGVPAVAAPLAGRVTPRRSR